MTKAINQAKLELDQAAAAADRGNRNVTLLHAGRALLSLGQAKAELGETADVVRMVDEAFGFLADIGLEFIGIRSE